MHIHEGLTRIKTDTSKTCTSPSLRHGERLTAVGISFWARLYTCRLQLYVACPFMIRVKWRSGSLGDSPEVTNGRFSSSSGRGVMSLYLIKRSIGHLRGPGIPLPIVFPSQLVADHGHRGNVRGRTMLGTNCPGPFSSAAGITCRNGSGGNGVWNIAGHEQYVSQ